MKQELKQKLTNVTLAIFIFSTGVTGFAQVLLQMSDTQSVVYSTLTK